MEYLLHILILVAIFAILAISLDLIAGHAGLVSIAQGAFYGIGAYTSAVLSVNYRASFVEAVLAAVGVSIASSFVVSLPSLRLRDDYFVIATFGFQMIFASLFNNWVALTNGPIGISEIPQPTIFGSAIRSRPAFLVLVIFFAAVAQITVYLLGSGPFGRVLHAIRENEPFAESMGKNTFRFKVVSFAISAGLAGLAGSLYSHYITYIDPSSFTVTESILIITMVAFGGPGSRWGAPLGAFALVTVPEGLRFVGLSTSAAANVRQILYGVVLVAVMVIRPRGLLGHRSFGRPKVVME